MNKKGFTLIELMIAVVILSIFILAVGAIVVTSWKFWNGGWEQVELQRDASYAFARIERIVRSGNSATVLGGGSGLQVAEGAATHIFQLSGNILQLVTGGNTENIASGVQNNTPFSQSGNTVTVTLALQDGNAYANFRTTILLRNPS